MALTHDGVGDALEVPPGSSTPQGITIVLQLWGQPSKGKTQWERNQGINP